MTDQDPGPERRIARLIRRRIDAGARTIAARRLSGGASQDTWLIETEDARYVLRRAPEAVSAPNPFAVGSGAEVQVIRAARAHGVPAPEIVWALEPDDGLGAGYVMRHVAGETLAPRLLRDPEFDRVRPTLARSCGRVMAQIHAVPRNTLPTLRMFSPATRLELLRENYATHPERRPVFELAFQWLGAHVPTNIGAPSLVHGDFRNGNLMIGPDGLRAVLDWELPHLGDGAEDLGWFCVPSWRFGALDKEAGGFGPMSEMIAGYEEVSGQMVDPDRVRFWMVLGTLFWGISCVNFALQFRAGDRTVERAAIGRRASETELDLLTMLAPRS